MENNKSLALIVNEALIIEKMLIESSGEVNEDIEKALAVNSQELALKVDGYVEIISRFESLEDYYKARADYFKEISSRCKKAVDRLKENIKFGMNELRTDEIKGLDMRFKVTPTSGTLKITDEETIPVEFKKEEIRTVIDTKSLKEAISKGLKIEGAEVIPGFSLRSYANTPERKSKKKEAVNE